ASWASVDKRTDRLIDRIATGRVKMHLFRRAVHTAGRYRPKRKIIPLWKGRCEKILTTPSPAHWAPSPPAPPAGAREINLMFTFPSPQRGEGPGATGRVQSTR